MSRLIAASVVIGLLSCGPSVSQLASSKPVGSLSGLVTDTRFQPLAGVSVTLVLGEGSDGSATFKATTNDAGGFFFKDLPAGSSGQLAFTKSGYGRGRLSVTVPSSAGNFPIDDGNGNAGVVLLTQLNGTQRFTVFSASGKPAKGVKGLLEVTPSALTATSGGTYGSAQGVTSVEAAADEAGVLTFGGIPAADEMARIGGTYSLTVGALDEDGDGVIDSLGTARSYSSSGLFTNPTQQIQLSAAGTTSALAVSSANLESLTTSGTSAPLRNALKPNAPITLVFNQPIVELTRSVKVVAEDCATNVAVTVSQPAPNVLSIAPATSWTTGAEYHVAIRATGLDTGTTRDFRGYFFAIDPTAPRPVGSAPSVIARKPMGSMSMTAFEPGDELYVVFDTPLTLVGGPGARLFFNFDLNGNGMIGNMDVGELGAPFTSGFALTPDEATYDTKNSTFTCRTNNYSSRYRVTYAGLPPGGLMLTTAARVTVPDDMAGVTGYQTAWGQVVTGDFNSTSIRVEQQ
jgi:hypothetical protein